MSDNQGRSEPFILFKIADITFGVPSHAVEQLEMIGEITPVPNAPDFVDGVISSRGRVIPAINLRARLGLERIPYNLQTRLIILCAGERTVGLIVDSAREFIFIPTEAIQPPPEELSGLSGDYLEGIANLEDRLVCILNVNEVLDWADGYGPSSTSTTTEPREAST